MLGVRGSRRVLQIQRNTGEVPVFRVLRPRPLKLRVKLGSQVGCAAVERCELRVIRLGDFDVVLLAELHDDVEEVHGVEVQLVAEIDLRLYVGSVFIGSDFVNDVDYDLFYLIFCHAENE